MKDRIDHAIEILGELADEGSNFTFKIIGITETEYLLSVPRHRELLRSHSGNFQFMGRMDGGRVAQEYATADYSILMRDPTRTTLAGSPTKLTESILAGVPPLISDVGDSDAYVTHMEDGILLPPGHEAKRAIRLALQLTPEDRHRMRQGTLRRRLELDPGMWSERIGAFLRSEVGSEQ